MFSYLQVFLCLTCLYCATGNPFLGEIKFKKNFEIEHKPLEFKPFEFIKEIITPFGKFGIQHVIGKRDLDSIESVESGESGPEKVSFPGSRYEVEEPVEPEPLPPRPPIRNVPLNLGPMGPGIRPLLGVGESVSARPGNPGLGPLLGIGEGVSAGPGNSGLRPLMGLVESVTARPGIPGLRPLLGLGEGVSVGPGRGPVVEVTPKPEQHIPDFKPIPPPIPEPKPEPPHIPETKPMPAPPNPPVVITPPPPRIERPVPPRVEVLPLQPQRIIPRPPPRGFNTDIAREEAINEYLKNVEQLPPIENSIAPEKPKEEVPVEPPPPPPPNPIVRGSRLAWYFGNMLLDFISSFLGGSRVLDRPISI